MLTSNWLGISVYSQSWQNHNLKLTILKMEFWKWRESLLQQEFDFSIINDIILYYNIPLNQVFMYHCNLFKIYLEREYFLVYMIKICIVCKGEHDKALLKQSFWFLLPVKRAFRDLPTVPSLFKRVCGKQSIYMQFSFPSMNFAYVCRRVKI